MRNELSVEIERSAADVFAFVNDQNQLPRWVGGLIEARITHETEGTLGTRFHQVIEEMGHQVATDGEVVAFEPNRRIALKLVGDGFESLIDHRLEPLGENRTRVHVVSETKFHKWALKLARPLIHAATQKKMVADFGRLKGVLEQDAYEPPR